MSELTLTVIRLGFLAVLWLFVLIAVSVHAHRPVRPPGHPAGPGRAARQHRAGAAEPTARQAAKPAKRPTRHAAAPSWSTRARWPAPRCGWTDTAVTIGRSHDSTLVLDDDYASSRHAGCSPTTAGGRRGPRLDQRHLSRPRQGHQRRRRSRSACRSGSARPSSSCGSSGPAHGARPALRRPLRRRPGPLGATRTPATPGPRLLVVADGMGGHAGGEVASSVAVAALAPLDEDAPGPDLLDRLAERRAPPTTRLREITDERAAADRHGHHGHRDPAGRLAARAGPRRRLPRLPAARRRADPDHPRPHVRADPRRPGPASPPRRPPTTRSAT